MWPPCNKGTALAPAAVSRMQNHFFRDLLALICGICKAHSPRAHLHSVAQDDEQRHQKEHRAGNSRLLAASAIDGHG